MSALYKHDEKIHNFDAANKIVPLVLKKFKISNVVDIGCGLGTWLKVFADGGVDDYLGVDGVDLDERVLKIPKQNFLFYDLTKPLMLQKKYDLAVCLEVVEHLPENASEIIVETLANASDTIMFSAAIPGQGGQNHLNEQWPSWWQDKFEKHGYKFHDQLRPLIWNEPSIEYWYKQNIFIVSKNEQDSDKAPRVLDIVHPETFAKAVEERDDLLNKDVYSEIAFKKYVSYFLRKKLKQVFTR